MEGGPRLMTLQPAQWRRGCNKQTEPVLIPSDDDMGGGGCPPPVSCGSGKLSVQLCINSSFIGHLSRWSSAVPSVL